MSSRRHGDFDAAEDAVQEALIAATAQWPVAGLPTNPRGWLYRVAMRRLMDQARSEVARRKREEEIAIERSAAHDAQPDVAEIGADEDDTLVLLFMCCHPALTPPSSIVLTLRAVGGLTTAEIANAFLVPEATMAQRISRTKQTIKASNIPFSMPTEAERAERLGAVLHVLYLIFNEGYAASVGPELHRTDLSTEAIRLTRAVHALLPDDGEVTGLLALMLLTDARRAARSGPDGELIPLDEQDRGQWDARLVAEGVALVSDAFARGAIGPYQLQAAIAAAHDEAARVEDTDWPRILWLYGLLERMADNPMVTLSRVIAGAMVHGPTLGLEQLEVLAEDARVRGHYRLHAVRAHLHERAGDVERAIDEYRAAVEGTTSIAERSYLVARAARLSAQ